MTLHKIKTHGVLVLKFGKSDHLDVILVKNYKINYRESKDDSSQVCESHGESCRSMLVHDLIMHHFDSKCITRRHFF